MPENYEQYIQENYNEVGRILTVLTYPTLELHQIEIKPKPIKVNLSPEIIFSSIDQLRSKSQKLKSMTLIKRKSNPKFKFATDLYNFGPIIVGKRGETKVKLKNEGEGEVQVCLKLKENVIYI